MAMRHCSHLQLYLLKILKFFGGKKLDYTEWKSRQKNSIPGPAVKCGKMKNMFEVSTADIIMQCLSLVSEE